MPLSMTNWKCPSLEYTLRYVDPIGLSIVGIEIPNNKLLFCSLVAKNFFNNIYIYSKGSDERERPQHSLLLLIKSYQKLVSGQHETFVKLTFFQRIQYFQKLLLEHNLVGSTFFFVWLGILKDIWFRTQIDINFLKNCFSISNLDGINYTMWKYFLGGSILILKLTYGPVVLVCIETDSTKIAWHWHVVCSNVTFVWVQPERWFCLSSGKGRVARIGWILVFRAQYVWTSIVSILCQNALHN